MSKRRVWRHPVEFRREMVGRLRKGEDIVALSRESGVHRSLLYKWRVQADRDEVEVASASVNAYNALRQELQRAKQALADKTLEVDFFRGALQKVEARSRQASNAGERASTTRSGR
jgi:transposase-like protein